MHGQAFRTTDQTSTTDLMSATESGEPNVGSAIKKCERSIIPFNAGTGNKSA
jgi:hypothetical protein